MKKGYDERTVQPPGLSRLSADWGLLPGQEERASFPEGLNENCRS